MLLLVDEELVELIEALLPLAPTIREPALHDGEPLGEIAGSVLILSGVTAGLYLAASSMTLLAVYSVTGAWLLVVGARIDTADDASGASTRP